MKDVTMDEAIKRENLRHYKMKLKRSNDPLEIITLQSAIKRIQKELKEGKYE